MRLDGWIMRLDGLDGLDCGSDELDYEVGRVGSGVGLVGLWG